MKLAQRILSRGMLILAAVLVALGYHFRAELFPQWFGPEARQHATEPASVADAPPLADGPAPMAEVAAPPPPVAVPDDTAATAMPEGADAAPPQDTGFAIPSDPAMVPFGQPPESASPSLAFAAPDTAMSPDEAPPQDPSVADTAQTADPLDAARSAYWAQDLDAAERLYRQAAETDPASADALGELGNVYYAQGRWADAATVYAGAIERLGQSGDHLRAEHLLRVLDGLDPERAQVLRAARQP